MDSYKLVNSQKVIDKALILGYSFDNHSNLCNKEMIILNGLGKNYYFRSIAFYNNCHDDFSEITQKDFLALPEPLKVGDWVKFDNKEMSIIFKITFLNEENEAFWNDKDDRYFNLDFCTKLTPEQIKILELE